MVKRKSALDDLLDTLLDSASFDWPLGLFITGISFLASMASLDWALARYLDHLSSERSFIEGFAEHLGWVYFGLPLLTLALTMLFATAALRTYQNHKKEKRDPW